MITCYLEDYNLSFSLMVIPAAITLELGSHIAASYSSNSHGPVYGNWPMKDRQIYMVADDKMAYCSLHFKKKKDKKDAFVSKDQCSIECGEGTRLKKIATIFRFILERN